MIAPPMSKRAFRNRPSPSIVPTYDRRTADVLAAGQYAAIDVDDPIETGAKLTVLRQLRGDPLARLHAHGRVDEPQYLAARAYQRDWEIAERGARAIDFTREAVDGGLPPEPLTDGQAKARVRLVAIERALGRKMQTVVRGVLIDGQTFEAMAVRAFGRFGEAWSRYYGKLFHDALDVLAEEYGFSNGPAAKQYAARV